MRMDYAVPAHRTIASVPRFAEREPVAERVERIAPDVIFATNRGPVQHSFDAHGDLRAERGAGGVVSGLLCAAQGRRISWISLAMNEADRFAARQAASHASRLATLPNVASRLVHLAPEAYQYHYDGFSNRVLWFLQHDLATDGQFAPEQLETYWSKGYVPANEAVARAVTTELATCEHSDELPPVVFHDYHLYLAPKLVRERVRGARLQHFIHIPWPEPDVWARLPAEMVRRIYEGLAANDVIGFQTERDVRNFLAGAARYLPGAPRVGDATLRWQGRDLRVAAYPIALTAEAVKAVARTASAEAAARTLLAPLGLDRGRKLILRVDRLEPTKNIVRGFEAYERLLAEHEELREQVVFLALLVPSRESLPIYQRYAEQVQAIIDRVNAQFGTPDWQPIVAVYGNDHARALACMRRYDVLLVNPLIDGMNLVVKEGAILNERDGAIVLSTGAGAYEQLQEGVLAIDPRQSAETADALCEALALSPERRHTLALHTRRVVLGESAGSWLERQLAAVPRGAKHHHVATPQSRWPAYSITRPLGDRALPYSRDGR